MTAIRKAVVAMVGDDGHRAAAAGLGTRIRDRDGAVAAVDALERLISDRPVHTDNPHSGRESHP